MKRSRLIALVMVAALMMTGAAYAAWSQTVNVVGEFDTGNMAISVVATGFDAYYHRDRTPTPSVDIALTDGDYGKYKAPTGSYAIEDINGNFDYSISSENFYPGSEGKGTVNITNDSTMPVYLEVSGVVLPDYVTAEFEMPSSGVQFSKATEFNPKASLIELANGQTVSVTMKLEVPLHGIEVTENDLFEDYFIQFRVKQFNDGVGDPSEYTLRSID